MENLPQFALKRLRETSPANESHPDADLLTAFAEQSLPVGERTRVMEHLARCGDCRDVVAMALPATEIVAAPAPVGNSGIGWLSGPVLRWGALAAGILAVTSVGVLQYRHRSQETKLASNVMQGEAAIGAPAADKSALSQTVAPPAMATSSAMQSETRKETFAARKAPDTSLRLARPAGRPAAGAAGGIGGGTFRGSGIAADTGQRLAFSNRPDSTLATTAVNPAPAPPQAPNSPASAQPTVVGPSSQAVAVSAAPSLQAETVASELSQNQIAQNQSELPLNGRSATDLNVVKAKDAVPPRAVGGAATMAQLAPPSVSPHASIIRLGAPRWAITSAGDLQRSYDDGQTWENVHPNAGPVSADSQVVAESAEPDRGPFHGLAQITGTVTDPSGVVVTTATVEVRQVSTGKKRTARTDAAGQFSLSGLAAGEYEVQVSCAGFRTTSQRMALQARDRAALAVNLAIAAASTVVEVTGAAPLVQAEAAVKAEPDSAYRDKKVQRAAAAGNPNPVFRALAATGIEVWAGGSAGALYHTTDGGNLWTRVTPSSAGATLTGDIVSIQFPDPQHGRIATSTGELWTTSDTGQTWSKQ